MKTAAIVICALAFVVIASPPAAEAKACGSVVLKPGHGWIVGGAGLGCGRMRKWARSMLLGNGQPPGWHCVKSGRGAGRSGRCFKGPNETGAFFVYYPPD